MKELYFNGRPQGLGNRIEQLILLQEYASKNNKIVNYFWFNRTMNKDRSYPILIKCKNINIGRKKFNKKKCIKIPKKKYDIVLNNEIEFTFKIPLLINTPYIAIHLRSGDRIKNNDSFKNYCSLDTFKKCVNKSIDIVLKSEYTHVYICSDKSKPSQEMKKIIIKKISDKKTIIEPTIKKKIGPIWTDFYYLAHASQIIMASKISTFCLTAALLKNIKVVSFFPPKASNLQNYNVNVELSN